jgi:glycosyltransferase involved in cell wall biosynthesis
MVFIGKDCGLQQQILKQNAAFQSRICVFDTMEKGRLFGVIRFAKLVILPSLFENLSNAGLEAMALGKPVLGTYGTAFEEIIRDGVNGFLVEPGNAAALGQKVLSCLERTDLEQIGENAYQSVLRFDSLRVAQQIIDYYQAVLSRA